MREVFVISFVYEKFHCEIDEITLVSLTLSFLHVLVCGFSIFSSAILFGNGTAIVSLLILMISCFIFIIECVKLNNYDISSFRTFEALLLASSQQLYVDIFVPITVVFNILCGIFTWFVGSKDKYLVPRQFSEALELKIYPKEELPEQYENGYSYRKKGAILPYSPPLPKPELLIPNDIFSLDPSDKVLPF